VADGRELTKLTAKIVAAYAEKATTFEDLPKMIQTVSAALATVWGNGEATEDTVPEPTSDEPAEIPEPASAGPEPAVPIKQSVKPHEITCLECGWSGLLLRKHISVHHHLEIAEYRKKWQLPLTYPFIAPEYAQRRSEIAKRLGLGQNGNPGQRPSSLSKQLEAFMQRRGITSQMALAEALDISQPMAGRLLKGVKPTRNMLARVMPQLNIPE
jgi:predicted transcriptional regulator